MRSMFRFSLVGVVITDMLLALYVLVQDMAVVVEETGDQRGLRDARTSNM